MSHPADIEHIEAEEDAYLFRDLSQIKLAGEGLYTAISIFKNERIAIFKGEVLTEKEADRRTHKGEDRYFIKQLNGRIFDSMHIPCFAKYANDAAGKGGTAFKNNAKIALDEEGNICLVATKTIGEGEEVFCSYGEKYWKES